MSQTGFETFITDTQRFLTALAQDNTRDWFTAHKPRYEAELKNPAEHLLAALAPRLEALSGAGVETKLFRPQRDVRFSKDKTPYHTHLHMLWKLLEGPGWFFGIAPDYVTAGAGMMGFDKDALDRYRAAVDGPAGAELAEILAALGERMDPPELKRVPAPYARDHPRGALLQRKSLVFWQDGLEPDLRGDLPGGLMAVFERFQPLVRWLRLTP